MLSRSFKLALKLFKTFHSFFLLCCVLYAVGPVFNVNSMATISWFRLTQCFLSALEWKKRGNSNFVQGVV